MIKPLMRPRTTVPVSIGCLYSTLGVAKPPAALPIRQKSIAPSRGQQENATIATNYPPSGRNAPSRPEGGLMRSRQRTIMAGVALAGLTAIGAGAVDAWAWDSS